MTRNSDGYDQKHKIKVNSPIEVVEWAQYINTVLNYTRGSFIIYLKSKA